MLMPMNNTQMEKTTVITKCSEKDISYTGKSIYFDLMIYTNPRSNLEIKIVYYCHLEL